MVGQPVNIRPLDHIPRLRLKRLDAVADLLDRARRPQLVTRRPRKTNLLLAFVLAAPALIAAQTATPSSPLPRTRVEQLAVTGSFTPLRVGAALKDPTPLTAFSTAKLTAPASIDRPERVEFTPTGEIVIFFKQGTLLWKEIYIHDKAGAIVFSRRVDAVVKPASVETVEWPK
jgi:hypothetical protein